MDKRIFLKPAGLAGAPLPFPRRALAERVAKYNHPSATALATNEDFWQGVRGGFRLKPDYINLENGYYNIQPTEILDAFIRQEKEVNYEGAYYMRTVQFDLKKANAARLATPARCPPDQLIITRNTTESP